ncbi:MAG: AAA family ATPase [Nitrosomonadales bacterium]|nr:AAA family ATPase [Nitrosomonadales bacterium]
MPTPPEATQQPPLIRALLSDPRCYDHAVTGLRLIETHISWVVLTGDFAYKIKKPVDMGFLDFSTLALRQQACADEVRLNRRLAADIYLGVVVITGSAESPHIGEPQLDTLPFEYAVQMRQFPPEATLDHLDDRGELGELHIDLLAARLARFHREVCAVAAPGSPWGEPDGIARPVAENFQLIEECLHDPAERQRLTALQAWSEAEHARLTPLLRQRKRDGLVRECHGDLHLGNLAWVDNALVIFDCIEFSAALRWIDVISEVAFCFMDLLHRQHSDLAFRFLNGWLEHSGDYQGVALLRYYAVYRAMVRAKVAALRAAQAGATEASRAEAHAYLHLAEQLTRQTMPRLWITHGLSGSGKTTLTQNLLQQQGMIRVRSDVERKRLFGLGALARSASGVAEGTYSEEMGRRTYAHLAHLAEGLLVAGWPVIVDAACLARWQRDLLREVAQRHRVECRILDVQAEPATLRERVRLRAARSTDASEADERVLEHQLETEQPLEADELSLAMQHSGSAG